MIRVAALILALALAGCSRQADDAKFQTQARLAAVENKVSLIDLRLQMAEAKVKSGDAMAPAPRATGVELIVSWPNKGGNDYRHAYSNMDQCEQAKASLYKQEADRIAAAHAKREREDAASGRQVIYGSDPQGVSVACLTQ